MTTPKMIVLVVTAVAVLVSTTISWCFVLLDKYKNKK